MQAATLTHEVTPLVYSPQPFQVTPKKLELTQIALDLVKRLNGTSLQPVSTTDVAMTAVVLGGSGWLKSHFFRFGGADYADRDEVETHVTNFYDTLAELMNENPEYNRPLPVGHCDPAEFDAFVVGDTVRIKAD
ncbi:MAG: hypothetical protein U1E06_23485 [Tabrizicola sp.]|nr:hypothetical protein [Tabrizicola sp.]